MAEILKVRLREMEKPFRRGFTVDCPLETIPSDFDAQAEFQICREHNIFGPMLTINSPEFAASEHYNLTALTSEIIENAEIW